MMRERRPVDYLPGESCQLGMRLVGHGVDPIFSVLNLRQTDVQLGQHLLRLR